MQLRLRHRLDTRMERAREKLVAELDYAGTMIEQMLLGLVAHRVGKRLEYDPATGRVTNSTEANEYLKRQYRPNWTLNG